MGSGEKVGRGSRWKSIDSFLGSQVPGKLGLGPFPRWPSVVYSGSAYRAESPACETGSCLHSLCSMQ